MSGSALRIPPRINLDEFERRLRAAGSNAAAPEDPLDELARLVGRDAPVMKNAGPPVSPAPEPEPPALRLRLPHIIEPENGDSEIEHLGPGHGDDDGATAGLLQHDHSAETDHSHAAPDFAAHAEEFHPHEASAPPTRRSGRARWAMGALVTIGAVGFVAAWAIKGAPGMPKSPPIILAAEGPTKVQPPSTETVSSPSDSASVLLKDQGAQPGPVNLVSNVEQPADLQAKSQSAAPPPAAPAAASAPSPAPAVSGAATVGSTAAPPAEPNALFPAPKRVKTVSVRPDGSLIASAPAQTADAGPAGNVDPASPATRNIAPISASAAAAPLADSAAASPSADSPPQPANVPVPRARPAAASAAPQPATPKVDLPTKLSGKSTTRVPIAKIDTTVAPGANSVAGGANAVAAPADPPPQQSPLQIVSNLFGGKPTNGQNERVAEADPAATASAPPRGEGSYAVQLAAPGSEQEAQGISSRLQSKYSAALAGQQPVIRQAEVNGRSLYRVRVVGMSKAEAVALCQKLKASGGGSACFVAKD